MFPNHKASTDDSVIQIDTGGGAHISGNLETGGNFIGRDQNIQGDLVQGDKKVITQRTIPLTTEKLRERQFLIESVSASRFPNPWQKSLYYQQPIPLRMQDKTHLVRPTPHVPDPTDQTTLPDTAIATVFDQMASSLLILGEPGTGKTTLLLELARTLLERAKHDDIQPLPAVFELSSWGMKKLPFAQWLISEMQINYNISPDVASDWIEKNELLLLLDGLDEVRAADRDVCVQSLNLFRQKHLVKLAICCRMVEFEQLGEPLRLQGAVQLQPLTEEQLRHYFKSTDPQLTAIQVRLQRDDELRRLANTPLMLNIITVAYYGAPAGELDALSTSDSSRKLLFDTYSKRMFQQRDRSYPYTPEQTLYWLRWLALGLDKQGQSLFFIEKLQPDWIEIDTHKPAQNVEARNQGCFYCMFVGLMRKWGEIKPVDRLSTTRRKLYMGIAGALYWWLIFHLFDSPIGRMLWGLDHGPTDWLLGGWSNGMSDGLIGGLSAGVISSYREITLRNWRKWKAEMNSFFLLWALFYGFVVGVLYGLSIGLLSLVVHGLTYQAGYGLLVGLSTGVAIGVLGGVVFHLIFKPAVISDAPEISVTYRSNQGIRRSLKYALWSGGSVALVLGGGIGLTISQVGSLRTALLRGIVYGLLAGVIAGMITGGNAALKHFILRLALWWDGKIPWHYARFLDYAADRLLLRKVGGGYHFVHRLLLEHIASLSDEEMASIVSALSTQSPSRKEATATALRR